MGVTAEVRQVKQEIKNGVNFMVNPKGPERSWGQSVEVLFPNFMSFKGKCGNLEVMGGLSCYTEQGGFSLDKANRLVLAIALLLQQATVAMLTYVDGRHMNVPKFIRHADSCHTHVPCMALAASVAV